MVTQLNWIEQLPSKQQVIGSSPIVIANLESDMVVWLLRIEYEGQLVEDITFNSFVDVNEYIIQDRKRRGDFGQKMSYFLSQEAIQGLTLVLISIIL